MIARRVLVAGGGIAGLTVAAALRGRAEVEWVERAPEWRPLGAGLLLSPNAVHALRSVGVDPAAFGRAVPEMALGLSSGRVRVVQDVTRHGFGPTYATHRADLHAALLAAAAPERVRFGATITSLAEGDDGVTVRLSDGAERRVDLVLGCDGLHSATRAAALGEAAPAPIYSGYTCWRAVCDDPGVGVCIEMWGRGARFGMVPLRDGRLYVFLVRNAPRHAPSGGLDALRAAFAGFADPAPAVLDALGGATLLHHDIDELPAPVWGTRRVWLLGDAAHAMTPNYGQGAAVAIEDAVVAARCLASAATIDEAFAALRARRHDRVARIGLGARRLGRVAQWENPLACALRDALVRLTPASAGDRMLRDMIGEGVRQITA